jgi:hypothetical protein
LHEGYSRPEVCAYVGLARFTPEAAGHAIQHLCSEITKEIYDAMNVLDGRINAALVDKCNQYELARDAPNGNLMVQLREIPDELRGQLEAQGAFEPK